MILALTFALGLQAPASPRPVEVSGAWLRAAQPKQVTGGYVLLQNRGDSAVALTEVRSPIAKTIELHSISERDGVMKMVRVEKITVPARGKVALEPGGYHLMLFELTRALNVGDRVTLTFVFDNRREVDVVFEVKERAHSTPSEGGFTLTDHTGGRWSLSDMQGRAGLVFFGYTMCADACPVAMAKVARTARALGEDAKELTAILVSVDPERDTPDVLKEYVRGFTFPLVALTGSRAEIDQVAGRFGVKYSKETSSSAAGYLISHTTTLFLVDKTGRVLHLYPSGSQADQIAADIRHLLRETPR